MRVFSLAYHDVVPDGAWDSSGFCGDDPAADPNGVYKLDVSQFERHLDAITAAVDEAGVDRARTAATLDGADADTVLLHFDDGGSSAMQTGALLASRGWRGHFWITTDRIGTPGFVTADDVRALHRAGHVVGSHSRSHPMRMGALSDAELDREWGDSLAALSDACGEPIATASVPGGYCTHRVVAAAARAGVTVLFNSEPTCHPAQLGGCVVLGRYSVKRATLADEAAAMAAGARAPRYRQWATWNAKKLVKRAGGEYWLAARRRILA